jgi:subtilisin family serine protease
VKRAPLTAVIAVVLVHWLGAPQAIGAAAAVISKGHLGAAVDPFVLEGFKAKPGTGEAASADWDAVKLRTGELRPGPGLDEAFDALLRTGQEPGAGAASEASQIGVMICSVPLQLGVELDLRELGVDILGVYPPSTYVVRLNARQLELVVTREYFHWIGRVPATLKIDPELQGVLAGEPASSAVEPGKAFVSVYDPGDAAVVAQRLVDLGVSVEHCDEEMGLLRCCLDSPVEAEEVAEWEEVSFLEPVVLPTLSLETSVGYCGDADEIRDSPSKYGSDVIVGMIDSGLEGQHDAFLGQGAYPPLYALGWNKSGDPGLSPFGDLNGHGTHVAGIILSRWSSRNLAGVCPWTGGDADHQFRVVRCGRDSSQTLYNPDQAMAVLRDDNQSLVVNNSWGNDSDNTGLGVLSRLADGIVWSKGQIWVYSAGNAGDDGPTPEGTIGSPAAAKNVIAVGSVDNVPSLGRSAFSSEGPTGDGRAKPDVYAPGSPVTSADALNLHGSVNKGGTSMAAPHVTGVLATLIGHHPAFAGRPAMAKAAAMASATRRSDLPTRTGIVNSYGMHFATSSTKAYYGYHDSDPRGQQSVYWDWDIPANVDTMDVVLTWIEPAPEAGASKAVINDFDLYVDYGRDDGDGAGGEWQSTSGVDNVEFRRIENPPAGAYRFKAYLYGVPQDARLGIAVYHQLKPTTTFGLSVTSAPVKGVEIGVTPSDARGEGDGQTDFTRLYPEGTGVELTAPLAVGTRGFDHWDIDGAAQGVGTNIITVTMDGAHSTTAHYAAGCDSTSFATPGEAYPMAAGETKDGMCGAVQYYEIVLAQAADVTWTLTPTESADFDLYTTSDPGQVPTDAEYTCRPYKGAGAPETCVLPGLAPGTYYAMVRYYSGDGSYAVSVETGSLGDPFPDVPPSHWAYRYIMACWNADIVQGYWNGYHPDELVTRAQMAVYIARGIAGGEQLVPPGPAVATFTDVPTDYWAYKHVEYVHEQGVVEGYWNGYHPADTVDRAQMAVFCARARAGGDEYVPEDPDGTAYFPDVPTDHWAYRYVEFCHDAGIVDGYWNGYQPDGVVSRAQMAVFVQRTFQLPM